MAGDQVDPEFVPKHGFEHEWTVDELRALTHPLRMLAYRQGLTGPVSAKDLAARLEEPLTRVSYHVRILADSGLFIPVRKTQRRGATETHYRSVASFDIDERAWDAPGDVMRATSGAIFAQWTDDVRSTIEYGDIHAQDFLLSRAHLRVTSVLPPAAGACGSLRGGAGGG